MTKTVLLTETSGRVATFAEPAPPPTLEPGSSFLTEGLSVDTSTDASDALATIATSITQSAEIERRAAEWRTIGLSDSQAILAARDDMARATLPDPPATFEELLESYGYRPGELGAMTDAQFQNLGLSGSGARAAMEGRDVSAFDRQTRERIARERDRREARPSVDFSDTYGSPQQARRAEAVADNQMGH